MLFSTRLKNWLSGKLIRQIRVSVEKQHTNKSAFCSEEIMAVGSSSKVRRKTEKTKYIFEAIKIVFHKCLSY